MARDVTSIEIKTDTWRELNQQKEPGDSFDDVVRRLLSRPEEPVEVEPEPPEEEEPEERVTDDAYTCPDCGRGFETFDALQEHMDENPDPGH